MSYILLSYQIAIEEGVHTNHMWFIVPGNSFNMEEDEIVVSCIFLITNAALRIRYDIGSVVDTQTDS